MPGLLLNNPIFTGMGTFPVIKMEKRLKISELEEGSKYEFWINSNSNNGGIFTGKLTQKRYFAGDIESITFRSDEGEKIKVYWPNAHAENHTSGVKSIGQLGGVYPEGTSE